MSRRLSCGWLTVTSPSAHSAPARAVGMLTAGQISAGGTSGRVHNRARSTCTRPSWVTSSPASSARMTSTHSRSRASRSAFRGQPCPVMCSLDASPLPRATQNRPGNIAPSVATAWATIAGWYRCPGALTAPKGRLVVAIAAPSHDQPKADCPCRALQGEKWSELIAAVKPTSSACRTASSSWTGWTCSCELWNPITGIGHAYRGPGRTATSAEQVGYPLRVVRDVQVCSRGLPHHRPPATARLGSRVVVGRRQLDVAGAVLGPDLRHRDGDVVEVSRQFVPFRLDRLPQERVGNQPGQCVRAPPRRPVGDAPVPGEPGHPLADVVVG